MPTYTNKPGTSGIILMYCPKGHKYDAQGHELEASECDCDLCGHHGDIEIAWFCQECKTGYIHTFRSW